MSQDNDNRGSSSASDIEDLAEQLARARRLLKEIQPQSQEEDATERFSPSVLMKLLALVRRVALFLLAIITLPYRLWQRWREGFIGRWLLRLWRFSAYSHAQGKLVLNSEGEPVFNRRRLLGLSVSYAALLFSCYVGWCALYFYGTQFTTLVYTTGKGEIIPGEKYQISACTSLPCSTDADNGIYYSIESSMFLPTLYYPEQDVYANTQMGAVCTVKGYGIYFRRLRRLFKYAEWYQHIYNVSCRPETVEESNRAFELGKKIEQQNN